MLEKKIKNSNIPYTQITKEVWLSLVKTLENEQIGEIITAMYEYIYEGKEPHFNSKVMNGQWDMLTENIDRMSKGYFNKVDNAKASAIKRMENKKNNSNSNIENKADLSPSNDSDDKICQPEVESGLNSLKKGKNEELKDNKQNNTEDMGNLLVFNQTTGRYEYPNKTKEEIKEKVIKNSLPTVQVAATAQTPSIPTFEEVLKDEKDIIEDIIKDFNAGGMKARVQAPTRLNELLNRK